MNPFKHLAAAVGWAVGLVSLLTALIVGLVVLATTRSQIQADTAALFAAEAANLAEAIDLRLYDRVRLIEADARLLDLQWQNASLPPERLAQAMADNAVGASWMGLFDRQGRVISDADGQRLGQSSGATGWFNQGLSQANVSYEPITPGSDPRIIVAYPVQGDGQDADGVFAAELAPNWLQSIASSAIKRNAQLKDAQFAVLTRDGKILAGNWQQSNEDAVRLLNRLDSESETDLRETSTADGGLVGYTKLQQPYFAPNTEWWVLVRETSSTAGASAAKASSRIFGIIALSGLIGAIAAALATTLLLARLRRIAENADALRLGTAQSFYVPRGRDEVARIGASLAALFNGLKTLNIELDHRVEERTREVQRLFEENKNAAVTRERLRMSRDLHDTLAHSMLATLTQIKMVRKIAKAKPELLEGELEEAERAAQEGLNTARGAVGQLRYQAVRDDGLGPALEKLVKKLSERIVVEAKLTVDPNLRGAASQVAETIHRIAEEALHNIEKHAQAKTVEIDVRLIGNKAQLVVKDDGIGFDPRAGVPGHYGLLGLREQAQLIGADINIESSQGAGCTITLTTPL